ncbi:MAG: hypothetical protein F4162_00650 [Synechococcus sp. SB0676_bin_10]|uniref:Uncharacterized protein n=1 Tax=Synechococcus sp. SB0676_bin_10 TaxID=2604869 RepID=A0A6B1F2A4_9SYNE|nr:hypothetical protein [Synechococcus sp. SB0664_bin_36]MYG37550.1 hypothetical protein [Synechococcus sp. SB0676_bin_10]MYK06162.1 hypothetical protein [Synechococcus sp. SB0670_bin_20]
MKQEHIPSTDAPHAHAGWSATWTGNVNGVINPKHSDLSAPQITLTADFDAATLSAGITYLRNGARTEALDTWNGINISSPSFVQDGLTGTFQDVTHGNPPWKNAKYPDHHTILGTVTSNHVAGIYRANRQQQ